MTRGRRKESGCAVWGIKGAFPSTRSSDTDGEPKRRSGFGTSRQVYEHSFFSNPKRRKVKNKTEKERDWEDKAVGARAP
ncbi:hypothetical protein VTJ04DRAFT_7217 [Mycothermus thermophilus]|uniref:uncharacterized protein n=1 Tax=Humicola insolens TaxID=85995 RepID=UPI0037447840